MPTNGMARKANSICWNADYPEITNFLDFHFGPGASDQFGDGFQDVWDALIKGGTTSDPAIRAEAYAEANNAIKANIPMVPVASGGAFSQPLRNITDQNLEGFARGQALFRLEWDPADVRYSTIRWIVQPGICQRRRDVIPRDQPLLQPLKQGRQADADVDDGLRRLLNRSTAV